MSSERPVYKLHTFFDPEENIFYSLDTEEKILTINSINKKLSGKPYKTLLLLVENQGRTVRDEEFFHRVWERKYIRKNRLTVQINNLRKLLGDNERQRIIETRVGTGYKFTLKVETQERVVSSFEQKDLQEKGRLNVITETPEQNEPNDEHSNKLGEEVTAEFPKSGYQNNNPTTALFGLRNVGIALIGIITGAAFIFIGLFFNICTGNCLQKTAFIVLGSVFYGLLAGIGVMLECAYQYDKYGQKAIIIIPGVFLTSGGAMFVGLRFADNLLSPNIIPSFIGGLTCLIIGALISCGIGSFVIPKEQVVKAKGMETQPAFTAFCKNILIYFLPLYSIFVLLIYCLFYTQATIINKPAIAVILIALWIIFFFFSFITTSFLSDKLVTEKKGEKHSYPGLYSSLLFSRMLLCFGPTGISTVIYSLNTLSIN